MSDESGYDFLREGRDKDEFIMTRKQLRSLADLSYEKGRQRMGKMLTFTCVRKVTSADNWWADEVARSKWLHIITARNLRKARKTIRELRGMVERLQYRCREKDLMLDGYRGKIGRDNPFAHVPDHYLGDGFVTCDRAIESASAQRCIGERSKLQFWYWATAFKYVWRMWSKEDPERDALKAIDCLEKAAGLGMLVREEREDG